MSISSDELPITGFRKPTPAPWKRLLRRVALVVLLVFLVLAIAATKVLYPELIDRPVVLWPDTSGYTRYLDPEHEWTLRFPDA